MEQPSQSLSESTLYPAADAFLTDLGFGSYPTGDIDSITLTAFPEESERSHCCDICGYSTSRRGDLTKHLRIHTCSKPYVCPVCERRFTQSSHLACHRRLHEK